MEDFLNIFENENLLNKDIIDFFQCLEDFYRFLSVDGEFVLILCIKDEDIFGNFENYDLVMEIEILFDGFENFKENFILKCFDFVMGSIDVCNFIFDVV